MPGAPLLVSPQPTGPQPPAASDPPKTVTNNPQDPYGDDKDVPQDASPEVHPWQDEESDD